jgi:hypothetical protein
VSESFYVPAENGTKGRTYAGLGYEPTRFARKHGITRQQAREIIKKVGNDRNRLNEAAEQLKRELMSDRAGGR